jgi:hypothetical protein
MSPQHGFGSGTDWAPAYARPVSPPAYPTEFDGEFKFEYAANPVAVRLAGGGVRKIATAGMPGCYRAGSAATLALLCSTFALFCSVLLLLCSCSALALLCPALLLSARRLRQHKTRLGCRLNAGVAQWAERHGCRESAARTWMSVRRVPTERRRSEGTRRSRAQPGARTLGYLVSFQVTRRRRNRSGVSQSRISRTAITWRIQISSCTRIPGEVVRQPGPRSDDRGGSGGSSATDKPLSSESRPVPS